MPFDHSPRSLRRSIFMPSGIDGAERGQRHEVADGHVERAAADLQRLAVAAIDVDQLDLVGVRVGPQVEHPGDDDAVEALAEVGRSTRPPCRGRSSRSPSATGSPSMGANS